nr:aldo/keto reductase [Leptospira johnsonii]
MHRPDPLMNADEVTRAFRSLKESGKVLYKTLEVLAKKKDTTLDAVLFSWHLFHPAQLVPVLGTNRPDRIRSATKAFQIQLEIEDWFRILEAGIGKRVP